MSLVGTYVRAWDGYLYADPVLKGEGWFICFDDDDPPELVVANDCPKTTQQILSDANVGWKNLEFAAASGRVFGEDFTDIRDARSYWFEITKPLDPKHISKNDGRSRKIPWQGVIYDFPNWKNFKV